MNGSSRPFVVEVSGRHDGTRHIWFRFGPAGDGSRFETYVIEGRYGAREMCVNGAAARLVQPGDRVIVVSYAAYTDQELDGYEPRVVHVDEDNRILRVDADPSAIAAQP